MEAAMGARRACVEEAVAEGAVPQATAESATAEARMAFRENRVIMGVLRARMDATAAEAPQDR
jgi:hypothetical protein